MKRAAVVILNWNNWRDTVECLESVFRSTYPDFSVVVVDNGSTDGSVGRILEWAAGSYVVSSLNGELQYLVDPPVPKVIPCMVFDREADGPVQGTSSPFLIIKTGINLGFAGGNNVALRHLMSHNDWDYIWLLNNDTIVAPNALSELVRRMEESPQAGMCGSLLPYYHKPDTIWAQGGGSFNRWLAKSACIGNGLPLINGFARDDVEKMMKYVAGASILVTRTFIEEIGLMCEDYFLYFEEPDWAFRGTHRFKMAYSPESIVYHKVGMSTGKCSDSGSKIDRPEDYIFRNSLKFTRTFFPYSLPLVFVRVSFNRARAWLASYLLRMRRETCE